MEVSWNYLKLIRYTCIEFTITSGNNDKYLDNASDLRPG